MQRLGCPLQKPLAIRRAVGFGDENLLKPFVYPKDLAKALLLYRRHHKQALVSGARLLPGVRGLLSKLKSKHLSLAVASNRPTAFSWILLRHLKIYPYFDYVLCADKLRFRKPHPQILNKIRKHFSLKPEQAIYIGDMVIDIQAGQRADIKTVAVTTGSNTIEELKKEKPSRIIKKIIDLLKLVL